MSFKSVVGLDAVDVVIHVGITALIAGGFLTTAHGGDEAAMMGTTITTASLVVFAIRRHLALRRHARNEVTTGEVAAERIYGLEQRVAELESAQARVYELEERLDFAERLLARDSGARALAPGRDQAHE